MNFLDTFVFWVVQGGKTFVWVAAIPIGVWIFSNRPKAWWPYVFAAVMAVMVLLMSEPWDVFQAWRNAPEYAGMDDWFTPELSQQLVLRVKFVLGSLVIACGVFALGSA